ncbi:MAG: helix-turn-helix domain-containing protein [Cytophagales bacterium]|nr:MAG: helix-turn-helix domain-containing protein [Cytophagales bacterium]
MIGCSLNFPTDSYFLPMSRKAKSRQEIAQEFGISAKTLSRWFLKEKLNIPKGLISPKNQD